MQRNGRHGERKTGREAEGERCAETESCTLGRGMRGREEERDLQSEGGSGDGYYGRERRE